MNNLADLIRSIKSRSPAEILKKDGIRVQDGRILCPAHEDKNPSCVLYNDGLHCFSCGWHGDVIDYFRVKENLSFIESVKKCANLCGLPMPERHGSRTAERCLHKGKHDFIFITRGKRSLSEKLLAKSFPFYEFSSFKVLDLTEFDKKALLEPNVVLLPEPGNDTELDECRLLSMYSGAEFLNWKICPVKTIDELEASHIARSLSGGVLC